MRIIAGRARGRTLSTPEGLSTRPTPDRVREALFSMLGPYVADSRVLDLYAGSGALGLEALSRGAASVTFVEQDLHALRCLKDNMTRLNDITQGCCQVVHGRVSEACSQLQRRSFDLVFMDPPYANNLVPETLELLLSNDLLASDALIVCEHGHNQTIHAAPDSLQLWRDKAYGTVRIKIFRREA